MPELPEVEVTKRALIPHTEGHTIEKLEIRETRLRWPIRVDLLKRIEHKKVTSISRRGKYILINTSSGTVMIHLGMSGSIGIFDQYVPPKKHDHFDIHLSNKKIKQQLIYVFSFTCFNLFLRDIKSSLFLL